MFTKVMGRNNKTTGCNMQPKLTYPVDVFYGTAWEVKIDNHIHPFEVNPSCQQSSADEDPDLPCSEIVDYVVSLEEENKYLFLTKAMMTLQLFSLQPCMMIWEALLHRDTQVQVPSWLPPQI